jgi:hypothetical protein
MRTPTLLPMTRRLRSGAILAVASLVLVGLSGCGGASPTEPTLERSIDRGRIRTAAKTVQRPSSGIDNRAGAPRGF